MSTGDRNWVGRAETAVRNVCPMARHIRREFCFLYPSEYLCIKAFSVYMAELEKRHLDIWSGQLD